MIETRDLQASDIPILLETGRLVHESTGQDPEMFDADTCRQVFTSSMTSPVLFTKVALCRGAVCGFIGGMVCPQTWSQAHPACYEVAFMVEPHFRQFGAGRALIEAFEEEGKKRGAKLVYMHSLNADDDGDRLCAMLLKMGYKFNEKVFMRRVT